MSTVHKRTTVGDVVNCRFIGIGTGFTCILIYTGIMPLMLVFMPDRPERILSVGVYMAGCDHLPMIV
jgi:hypothetical protein